MKKVCLLAVMAGLLVAECGAWAKTTHRVRVPRSHSSRHMKRSPKPNIPPVPVKSAKRLSKRSM